MRRALPLLVTCSLLAACAEDPFVEHFSRTESTAAQSYVQKEETALSRTGRGEVCFAASTPMQDVQQTAQDACAEFGLQAMMDGVQRYQCRMTNPHVAYFHCVDPAMRTEQGEYVNVFNPRAVAAWEKRTGKKAPLRQSAGAYMSWPQTRGQQGAGQMESRPVLSDPQAPVQQNPTLSISPPMDPSGLEPAKPLVIPAVPSSVPVLTPPSSSSALPAQPVPAAPGSVIAPSNFSLPVGSWSDHF